MKIINYNQKMMFVGIGLWWLIFTVSSFFNLNQYQILNASGFLFLVLVPGGLTLANIGFRRMNIWMKVSFAVAFSVLELIILGLLLNSALPLFGIARPLEKPILLIGVSALTAVLMFLSWINRRNQETELPRKICWVPFSIDDVVFSLAPVIFVILSILGSNRLNNGENGSLIMLLLGGVAIYFAALSLRFGKIQENTIRTGLFLVSLSLLLMTSLRGYYITGHDIQIEYRVFQFTNLSSLWRISSYQDPYNACMSITILPTIFSKLLHVFDPYVYKVFFQLIFALTPGIIYSLSRNWFSRGISFVGTFYFIAFPTFFLDMPFLIRQETAFLFFGLMLYVIFRNNEPLRLRRIIFVIMGIGVILSHYSTTYTILLILVIMSLSVAVFHKIFTGLKNKKFTRNLNFCISGSKNKEGVLLKRQKISVGMITILIVLNFSWISLVTHTGEHTISVIEKVYQGVKTGFFDGSRSLEVINLINLKKPEAKILKAEYENEIVKPIRQDGYPGEYYSEDLVERYPTPIVGSEKLSVTGASKFFERKLGIDILAITSFLGKIMVKITGLMILLGLYLAIFKNPAVGMLDLEYYFTAFCGLVFVAMTVILPILSLEYGVLRALQQALFTLSPFIALAGFYVTEKSAKIIQHFKITKGWTSFRNFQIFFNTSLAIVFFWYSSSFIPHLFGNGSPVLHLDNAGEYYDTLYTTRDELTGARWLDNEIQEEKPLQNLPRPASSDVQIEYYLNKKIGIGIRSNISEDIYPALIRSNAFVFLGETDVYKQKSVIRFDGNLIGYSYPIDFLDDNKDLIYNNRGARIYR